MQITFNANLESLPNKIEQNVRKKVQAGHPTRPTAHQLDKIKGTDKVKAKREVKGKKGQRKLFSNSINNGQD